MKNFLENLKKGIKKLKENPQLWYSIFVAFIVFISFTFIVTRFLNIAKESQDRLANRSASATLDAFIEFVPEKFQTTRGRQELQDVINRIVLGSSTILDLVVVEFVNDEPQIISSIHRDRVGEVDLSAQGFYNIAKVDPNNIFAFESVGERGERVFKNIKVIRNQFGEVIGAANLTHSLVSVDARIQREIEQSMIIFVVIVIALMVLFFRYARIIDYSTLYRKLKEVDNLKDDFISMASHELRTPLTIIRGYAEELKEFNLQNEEFKVGVERIETASEQLDHLVNDMLDVSKIEQGRMKMEMKTISPVDVLTNVVSGLKKPAEDKGLILKFEQNLKEEKINIDENRFRQVMTNLIGNAVKYTKKGQIAVTTSTEDNSVVFRVQDSGIGISAEDQKKLFQKFSRIKNAETSEIRGTGLGLWITQQIVEQMKGKISVESITGVGSSFIVKFPLAK